MLQKHAVCTKSTIEDIEKELHGEAKEGDNPRKSRKMPVDRFRPGRPRWPRLLGWLRYQWLPTNILISHAQSKAWSC